MAATLSLKQCNSLSKNSSTPRKIYDLGGLWEKGWMHVKGSGLYTNKFVYNNIRGGERGIHYAMDDEELGQMIEKYGMDHEPKDPHHN